MAEEDMPCAGPGCSGIGTKFCSHCKKEAYCSRDCQVKAWKSHKLVCQKVDSVDNAIRELFKQGKLYSAREQLRQLPTASAKLEAELAELVALGVHSEILGGALRLEDVGELGLGFVAARDLAAEEPLLFDTAFLTAPVNGAKAPHFLMAEKIAKRLAGGARRKSAKADVQADFFFNTVKAGLPLKHGMVRAAIEEASIEDDVRDQMLVCAIVEGCALYCTEEPEHMALYPVAARLNHSCAPNARIESDRSTLVVRANCPIAKGAEVFITYLPTALLEEPGEQRRARLEGGRGFECACEKCRPERDALTGAAEAASSVAVTTACPEPESIEVD